VNIYIICAVRNASPDRVAEIRRHAEAMRFKGHQVHFPPDDAPQDDPTGAAICRTHLKAMKIANEVHVFWDVRSSGSHFDLGMAYALGKKIVPLTLEMPDGPEKSYWKAVINPLPCPQSP
jgi:predicted TIM-barrel fold metal-dependent hydrolase